MFTGIIRGIGKISNIKHLIGLNQCTISLDPSMLIGIEQGASVAIDGTCLTVVDFSSHEVSFDVIQETLDKTNLNLLKVGDLVNVERAARFGDEIGGHVLSGHIFETASIVSIDHQKNNYKMTFRFPHTGMKYLFPKGYIALNGASLTLVDVNKEAGMFTVHLIPETLAKTTFGMKKVHDRINVEIDTQTQVMVDTIEALYVNKSTN
jgi:riboflavin synthase